MNKDTSKSVWTFVRYATMAGVSAGFCISSLWHLFWCEWWDFFLMLFVAIAMLDAAAKFQVEHFNEISRRNIRITSPD